jgi:hypothetical protein
MQATSHLTERLMWERRWEIRLDTAGIEAGMVNPNFVASFGSRKAGPSTPFGAKNAPNFAQDDRALPTSLRMTEHL